MYDVPDPVNDVGASSSIVDFNYDGLSNRDSVVTDSVPTYSTHNNMNEYHDVGGMAQVHDNNGNLTDDGTYLYTWDYENRLIEVRLKADNSLVSHYYYDALSRRIEKQTPTETTRYYYDGAHVIEERDGTDTVLADYTYGRRIDEILTMKRGGETYYYHTNALGGVSAVTDSTGATVERYTYTAYGEMTITDAQGNPISSSAIGNPYGFTGRRYDEETGLWYDRNRYYNAETGRFISRDPLGYVDGANLYEYVRSNPINFIDPSGTTLISGIIGRIGQAIDDATDGIPVLGDIGNAIGDSAEAARDLEEVAENLPNTMIGVCIDIGCPNIHMEEAENWDYPDIIFAENSPGFDLYHELAGRYVAITFGDIISFPSGVNPEQIVPTYDHSQTGDYVVLEAHGWIHALQYDDLGILFIPLYIILDPLPGINPLEQDADNRADFDGDGTPDRNDSDPKDPTVQ